MEELLNETRTIQKRLPQLQKPQTTYGKAKIFAKFVLEGKINAAIRLLMMILAVEFCRFQPTLQKIYVKSTPMQNHQMIP